jgi:hypothetical protein
MELKHTECNRIYVRFQVLTAASMKLRIFWEDTAVFLIEYRPTFQRFVLPPPSGPDDGGSTYS